MTGFELAAALRWPVAVVVLVIFLAVYIGPDGVRAAIQRTRSVKWPGGGIELDAAGKLQEELEQSGPLLVGSTREDNGGQLPPGSPGAAANDPATIALREQSLEDVVQRAAEWGAARARSGQTVEGVGLQWSDGSPRLELPPGTPQVNNRGLSNAAMIAELRAQEVYLRDQMEYGTPGRANWAHKRLNDVQARLKSLTEDSWG